MFTCDFSKRGNLTLSDFLYENLKQNILEQKFKPNEKLPSKRNLSNHLGISVITVANTYERLISEGYIYSIHGKGSFASASADPGEARKQEMREKIREMTAELRYLGASEEELLALIREVQA